MITTTGTVIDFEKAERDFLFLILWGINLLLELFLTVNAISGGLRTKG
jgi:hypothetical protein